MQESNLVREKKKFQVIGTRPKRPDGTDKVTGRALYGGDINLPSMIYGEILRSPHAHAKIISIDYQEALAIEGVKAVITAEDFPSLEDVTKKVGEGAVNIRYRSNNILAKEKVLYQGHPIAAVAAKDKNIARLAIEKIIVKYEILSPVLDVREAMKEDAPILLEELRTVSMGEKIDKPTNIAKHIQLKRGNIEYSFAESDIIIEREFYTSMVHQGYIEPQSVTALYNNDGDISVWTSTQGAFIAQQQISDVLNIPLSKINVIPMEIGGGFGGKVSVYLDPVAILLSKKSGSLPVKITMSRKDVLMATGPTSGSYIKVKLGAKNNGIFTAVHAYLAYEAGAYPGSPVGGGAVSLFAPYKLDHLLIDAYDVVVNKPKSEPYRAPGTTNAIFASESIIDEIAVKLKIDPIELRLINAVKEGDRRIDGPTYGRIGLIEILEEIKAHPHYHSKLRGKYQGRGIATGFWFNYAGKSSVYASINGDGTVNLIEGSTDIGGSRASMAMQLAETMELPYESIIPKVVDTNSIGYTEGTYGSRTTYSTGWATHNLGNELIRLMKEKAAAHFETEIGNIVYSKGNFTSSDKEISFIDLAKLMKGNPVTASSSIHPKRASPGFGTHIVDVEVDPETYKVTILRYTAFQDVGTAIHPSYVEGQIQGGVVQGIGWALNEEYIYDDTGNLVNHTLLDYRMPTSYDLPMIDTVLIEVPDPDHPFGVKGVGEVPIVPPAAAIANAINDAIGHRLNRLPMSPKNIFESINQVK